MNDGLILNVEINVKDNILKFYDEEKKKSLWKYSLIWKLDFCYYKKLNSCQIDILKFDITCLKIKF